MSEPFFGSNVALRRSKINGFVFTALLNSVLRDRCGCGVVPSSRSRADVLNNLWRLGGMDLEMLCDGTNARGIDGARKCRTGKSRHRRRDSPKRRTSII